MNREHSEVYLWGSSAGCLSPSAQWWSSKVLRPCRQQTGRWGDDGGDSSGSELPSGIHGGSTPSLRERDRGNRENSKEVKKNKTGAETEEEWGRLKCWPFNKYDSNKGKTTAAPCILGFVIPFLSPTGPDYHSWSPDRYLEEEPILASLRWLPVRFTINLRFSCLLIKLCMDRSRPLSQTS